MGPSWGPKRPGALVSCTPKPPLSVGLHDSSDKVKSVLFLSILAEILATPCSINLEAGLIIKHEVIKMQQDRNLNSDCLYF